jgi:hypothetical protein
MAEYAGSAVVVQWIHSGGTLTLSGETRTCTVTPSMDTIDATAGSDVNRVFLPSFSSWDVTWDGVAQENTTAATSGTAYAQALQPGKTGTIIVGPYGTATTSLKYSMPAFAMGAAISIPYADVVSISAAWKTNSGGSMTVGAW